MLIEITQPIPDCYKWAVHDGPDGVDERRGMSLTLAGALAGIENARREIAASYTEAEQKPESRDYSTYPDGTIFRLRNGDTATKTGTDAGGVYCVKGLRGSTAITWTPGGRFSINFSNHPYDIVGVCFNPEANIPAASDSTTTPDPSRMPIDLSAYPIGTIFRNRAGELLRLESCTQGTPERPYTLCAVEGSRCGIYPKDGFFGDDPSLPTDCDLIEVVATKAPEQPEAESSTDPVEPIDLPERNVPLDPWQHHSERMRCYTCMWYVEKRGMIGRCRRHAPTMNGYPVVTVDDWCGDHKLNEDAAA